MTHEHHREGGAERTVVYLITGGTGSFGNAMTSRLLSLYPGCGLCVQVRIFSRDEVKQAEMRARFGDDPRLRFLLGDVRDLDRLFEAMRGVDTVFHAAAMKRVEACAYDPEEAVRTNVLGSMNVAAAAKASLVGRVVALSTDKACAPSTIYGATKLCMESVFTSSAANAERRPAFSVVRYGNVMSSRGGVVGLWRDALSQGVPLPITDPEATRFWFSVEGAVDLALWAAGWARGGELIVPQLPGFTLGDLAAAMCGTGKAKTVSLPLRPGEKRHELMVSPDEAHEFREVWKNGAHESLANAMRARHDDWREAPRNLYVRFLPGQGEAYATMDPGSAYSSKHAPRLDVAALRERLGA